MHAIPHGVVSMWNREIFKRRSDGHKLTSEYHQMFWLLLLLYRGTSTLWCSACLKGMIPWPGGTEGTPVASRVVDATELISFYYSFLPPAHSPMALTKLHTHHIHVYIYSPHTHTHISVYSTGSCGRSRGCCFLVMTF